MSVTKQKRRQLELRVIGTNTEDVQKALESIIKNCYPSAYYSQVKEYDHEEFRFRAYISIVLNDKEDA
jgi:hypothetical protein